MACITAARTACAFVTAPDQAALLLLAQSDSGWHRPRGSPPRETSFVECRLAMDFTGRPMRGLMRSSQGVVGERLRRWVERAAAYAATDAEDQ